MELFSRIRTTGSLLVLLITALLLHTPQLYAQATTGSVLGIVADKTGALIPNATVVLVKGETGSKRKTTSNGSGHFVFSSVVPGLSYTLEVSAPNFRLWRSQPFPLRPDDQIPFDDIKLEVGTATDTVVVESISDSIKDLDSGERSEVITAKELSTLSVVGRDATELIRTLPGFAMSSGSSGVGNRPGYNSAVVGLSGPTGSFSANGNGTDGTAVVQDGVSLTDIGNNSGTVQSVNIDMVAELKVSSSGFSAEDAKGPSVINAIGKSGSSSFHGSSYFYTRNTDLNANDWYNNYLLQTRPAGTYYYPGGSLGGPVILPKWLTGYNRNRDKLFFQAAFEYYNQNFLAPGGTLGAVVPTISEREGKFDAESLNAELCGARPDGKTNPNSITAMCYTQNYLPTSLTPTSPGMLVPNNNVSSWANASGRALVNWLPQPNADPFTNTSGYNYIEEVLQRQNGMQIHGRLDYKISDNDNMFISYGMQRQISQNPVSYGWTPTNSVAYPGDVTSGDISNTISLNYSHVMTATLTNEATVSMSFVSNPGNMGSPEKVSRFSMNPYNCTDPTARAAGTCGTAGLGNFNYLGMYKNGGDYSVPALSDYSSLGYPNLLMPGGFYANKMRMVKAVPDIKDTVSWVKGAHYLKAGVYVERGYLNGLPISNAYPQGEYSFNPGTSYYMWDGSNSAQGNAPSTTSQFIGCEGGDPAGSLRNSGAGYLGSCMNGVALMYMGFADSYTQSNFSPTVDMQYNTYSGFLNDSWKLRRMTLTLGARFEHLGTWFDRHNNGMATFSSTLYNTQCGTAKQNPDSMTCTGANMPGMDWHGIDAGVQNSGNTTAAVWISPRVGFAWDAYGNGDTVVRGGWGIYRATEEFQPYGLAAATAQGYKNSYLQGQLSFDNIDANTPNVAKDFNAYVISPTDNVRPEHFQYSVTVSQKAPWHSLIELAYVGSKHDNLSSYGGSGQYSEASDINIIPAFWFFNNFTTTQNLAPNTGTDLSNMTTEQQDYYRPNQFYQHIFQLTHTYYSRYDSAQLSWNKNAGPVQFGANYTFSKNLATAASYNNVIADPVNLRNDYNPVPYDHTQVFNIHYLIELNRYKGGNKLLAKTLNNWQISGISTVQSGMPLASEEGSNFSFGYGSVTPVAVTYRVQSIYTTDPTCNKQYGLSPYCVSEMSPAVWLGSPDVQLMPTLKCDPTKGLSKNQFINPTCFGIPAPNTNGQMRIPYIHGPAYMNHDLTVLKNFYLGEKRNLQVRAAGFNFLNHPLVSFDNNNTGNLNLGFQNGTVGQALNTSELTYSDFGVAGVKAGARLVEVGMRFDF